MIRKLLATVFSVSALFFAAIVCADSATLPNGAISSVKANDKLLLPLDVSKSQDTFEQGMAAAGWDIHNPCNLVFYNVRQIIARNEIVSLQNEINKKIALQVRISRAVDRSA